MTDLSTIIESILTVNKLYQKGSRSTYQWYILALSALTFTFVVAMPIMCMPVLFKEISEDLNLSLVQIGIVWGMIPLTMALFVLIGGLLSDRFGVKRALSTSCLLAGMAVALRGLSGSFFTLAATMFFFGLFSATISVVVPKTCGIWFAGRRLALANGVVSMGMAVGFMVGALISATILSPLLGGWQNVLFLYGSISVVIGILWLFTRSKPLYSESLMDGTGMIPFRQVLSRVIRIRRVWLLGFVLMGQIACVDGALGYLPLYLRGIGWPAATADGALAAFHAISITGVIPVVLLSSRLGSKRVVLFAATAMTAVGVGLLSVASGPMVWVSVVIAGIVRDGFMATLMTAIIETERVGPAYAGTAIGLVLTIARLVSFISPPIGNSLADINPGLPFVFWAGLAAIALFSFYFFRQNR